MATGAGTLLPHDKESFLGAWSDSLGGSADGTFIKLTLGRPAAASDIRKIVIEPATMRGKPGLRFVYSYATKDITKNFSASDGLVEAGRHIGLAFKSATLFTSEHDLSLSFNKHDQPRVTKSKPSQTTPVFRAHDRAKQYTVDPSRPYLHALGITLDDGRVKPSMYAKFRQICHFIAIIDDLIRLSPLSAATALSVIDIGAGKGYLTFALYDYLTAHLNKSATVTGIEVRPDLVAFCTDLARRLQCNGLAFEAATAEQAASRHADLLIALHACDTATDDAIFHGIAAGAAVIVVAPCCQHEIAPQLADAAEALRGLTKFGLFKQRQADLVTDAARCLLLEACGYKVKVIEFVSTEHTAKNILIAATKSAAVDRARARRQYDALKVLAGFEVQHLETRLANLKSS